MYDFDLFVIGGGSGGVACARRAATYGARVAIAEESRMGGTCVHRGCIPKKLMVYASQFSHENQDSLGYGWTVDTPTFDWSALINNKNSELDRLEKIYRNMLKDAKVKSFDGRAVLSGANELFINGEYYTADNILIATGGLPNLPDIPGVELGITSNQVFDIPYCPDRVVIVGGGYIACELSGIFNGLGAKTLQLHRSSMILRGFDRDLQIVASEEVRKSGVEIALNESVERLQQSADGVNVITSSGKNIKADIVLFATGRVPNTSGIGLSNLGVNRASNGAILVDSMSKSNIPNVYAVGDCTDRVNLTPVAIHEGRCLAETLYNNNRKMPDHSNIATAVFTQPEIGTVGLTEAEAKLSFEKVLIFKTRFRPLKHTLSKRDTTIFMKLVVDELSDRVIGCHMVGEGAGELVQVLGIAIKAGATKQEFDDTMAVHPTAAEEFVTMYTVTEAYSAPKE